MSVLLETDTEQAIQSHLDELTLRTTILFVSVSLLTLAWSFVIDDLFMMFLNHIQPCAESCLNLYQPAQWSAIRWLSSLLLGMISTIPLALHHIHQFSRPGLLDNEYKSLKRTTYSGTMIFFVMGWFMLYWAFPTLYSMGHEHQTSMGLVAQYSVVEMVVFAAISIWILMLFMLSWSVLVALGYSGVLTNETADHWRWKIYGIGTLLILLSMPEGTNGLTPLLLILYWATCETIGRNWFNASPSQLGKSSVRLDYEGRQRRLYVADCSCLGANTHHGLGSINGYALGSFEALCANKDDRNRLLEHTIAGNYTDILITGCDTKACPERLKNNLNQLGCSLRGLDLMGLGSYRAGPAREPRADFEMALMTIGEPFPEHQLMARVQDFINNNPQFTKDIHMVTHSRRQQGPYFSESALLIRVEEMLTGFDEFRTKAIFQD